MYKVFFNERLFHIKTGIDTENGIDAEILNISIAKFLNGDKENIVFETRNPEAAFSIFKNHFQYMEAAGGLVFNEKNEFLYIERMRVPDLPKGKIEKFESPENAALREVEEECGISDLKIVGILEPSYHIYFQKRLILKKTFWFEMFYNGNSLPKPQIEEQISSAAFIAVSRADKLKNLTYGNLKHLFDYAFSHRI
jgi:8-oxo-dGTP pyrophosphatase MutT (NUDIX family)